PMQSIASLIVIVSWCRSACRRDLESWLPSRAGMTPTGRWQPDGTPGARHGRSGTALAAAHGTQPCTQLEPAAQIGLMQACATVCAASAQQKSGNDFAAFLFLTYQRARTRRKVTPNDLSVVLGLDDLAATIVA